MSYILEINFYFVKTERWNQRAASGLSRLGSDLSDSPHNAAPGLGLGAVRMNDLYLFSVLAHFAPLNH
jgi:hypothetical protein